MLIVYENETNSNVSPTRNKKNEDSFSCLSLNVLNLTMQKKWVMWAFDWKVYDIVVYIVCLTVG